MRYFSFAAILLLSLAFTGTNSQLSIRGFRPSRCPIIRPGQAGICIHECSNDWECPGNGRCCSNGCGYVCSGGFGGGGTGNKPGSCPNIPPGRVGICVITVDSCSSDRECPGTSKCCSNGCGRVCSRPRFYRPRRW